MQFGYGLASYLYFKPDRPAVQRESSGLLEGVSERFNEKTEWLAKPRFTGLSAERCRPVLQDGLLGDRAKHARSRAF